MERALILRYLRKILIEHTLPLSDSNVGLIEADWLLDMIHKLEEGYRQNGIL